MVTCTPAHSGNVSLPATAMLTDAAHESVVFVIVVIVALSVVEAAYVTHCILCVCVCVCRM